MAGKHAHIVIAGPGRSGTTLLVQLLDALGLETRSEDLVYFERARAGLEAGLLDDDPPRVVKAPELSMRLGEYLADGRLRPQRIEHVLIPIRDLEAAARSRVHRSVTSGYDLAPGGYWLAKGLRAQRTVLTRAVYELALTLARYEIAHTWLEYPRFARDQAYAFRSLRVVLPDTSAERFGQAWRSVVRPELIRGRDDLRTSLAARLRWRLTHRRRGVVPFEEA